MSLLSVKHLDKRFGGLHAVKDVSLEVQKGDILGILGPNGAGKTTLYNLLTGFIKPDNGEVLLEGQPLLGLPPHQVVGLGVARTFQLCRPFVGLSVLENVMVGSLGPRVPAVDLTERARHLLAQLRFLLVLVVADGATGERIGPVREVRGTLRTLVAALAA